MTEKENTIMTLMKPSSSSFLRKIFHFIGVINEI